VIKETIVINIPITKGINPGPGWDRPPICKSMAPFTIKQDNRIHKIGTPISIADLFIGTPFSH
jgi:hypothetical protein